MTFVDEGMTSDRIGVNKESVSYRVAATTGRPLTQQRRQGFRVVTLMGNTILEGETLLLLVHLGQGGFHSASKCSRRLIEKQLPGDGWPPLHRRASGLDSYGRPYNA